MRPLLVLQRGPIQVTIYVSFCGDRGDCLLLKNDWNYVGPCNAQAFGNLCDNFYFAEAGLACVDKGTIFSSGTTGGYASCQVCYCYLFVVVLFSGGRAGRYISRSIAAATPVGRYSSWLASTSATRATFSVCFLAKAMCARLAPQCSPATALFVCCFLSV